MFQATSAPAHANGKAHQAAWHSLSDVAHSPAVRPATQHDDAPPMVVAPLATQPSKPLSLMSHPDETPTSSKALVQCNPLAPGAPTPQTKAGNSSYDAGAAPAPAAAAASKDPTAAAQTSGSAQPCKPAAQAATTSKPALKPGFMMGFFKLPTSSTLRALGAKLPGSTRNGMQAKGQSAVPGAAATVSGKVSNMPSKEMPLVWCGQQTHRNPKRCPHKTAGPLFLQWPCTRPNRPGRTAKPPAHLARCPLQGAAPGPCGPSCRCCAGADRGDAAAEHLRAELGRARPVCAQAAGERRANLRRPPCILHHHSSVIKRCSDRTTLYFARTRTGVGRKGPGNCAQPHHAYTRTHTYVCTVHTHVCMLGLNYIHVCTHACCKRRRDPGNQLPIQRG